MKILGKCEKTKMENVRKTYVPKEYEKKFDLLSVFFQNRKKVLKKGPEDIRFDPDGRWPMKR